MSQNRGNIGIFKCKKMIFLCYLTMSANNRQNEVKYYNLSRNDLILLVLQKPSIINEIPQDLRYPSVIAASTCKNDDFKFILNNPREFHKLENHRKTYEVCLVAVAFSLNIHRIPENYKDYNMYLEYVLCEGHINGVPKEFYTEELLHKAIKYNHNNARYIARHKWRMYCPNNLEEKAFWRTAFNLNPETIMHAPTNVLSHENYLTMLNSTFGLDNFEQFPMEIRVKYIDYMIAKRGALIRAIPEIQRTEKLCNIAFFNDISAYKYFPNEIKNPENTAIACNYPSNIPYIRKDLFTTELINKILEREPSDIAYIPEEQVTQEMVDTLTQNFDNVFELLPDRYQTRENAIKCLRYSGDIVMITEKFRTADVVKAAVEQGLIAKPIEGSYSHNVMQELLNGK